MHVLLAYYINKLVGRLLFMGTEDITSAVVAIIFVSDMTANNTSK